MQDAAALYPESGIPHPEVRRMRWRCRRGLLELDLVLERFVEHYAELDDAQRKVFDELLSLPDTALWDIIGGKMPVDRADQRELLSMINAA